MAEPTNQRKALEKATAQAAARLADVDLSARCSMLGLDAPEPDGTLLWRPVLIRITARA